MKVLPQVLLYEYKNLDERESSLKLWKAWHVVLYILVILLGILNYTFLLNTKQLVDDHCVLYPEILEFHLVDITESSRDSLKNESTIITPILNITTVSDNAKENDTKEVEKREVKEDFETNVVVDNVTVLVANRTHHILLDTSRSIFGRETTCDFAEYLPIFSTFVGILWTTLFIMCPGGGLVKRGGGLPEPWRILAPALVIALVMFCLTAHSFVLTNGGIGEFCREFQNYTNSTTCSSINEFLELGRNATWGFGGRAGAVRAASAGVWASWTCVAALLVARCIVAPDFVVRRTAAYLVHKGDQKSTSSTISERKRPRSRPDDDRSIKSEPTLSSQMVTASIEHEPHSPTSGPTSINFTTISEDEDVSRHLEKIELSDRGSFRR